MACSTCGCERDHVLYEHGDLCGYAPQMLALLVSLASSDEMEFWKLVNRATSLLFEIRGK